LPRFDVARHGHFIGLPRPAVKYQATASPCHYN